MSFLEHGGQSSKYSLTSSSGGVNARKLALILEKSGGDGAMCSDGKYHKFTTGGAGDLGEMSLAAKAIASNAVKIASEAVDEFDHILSSLGEKARAASITSNAKSRALKNLQNANESSDLANSNQVLQFAQRAEEHASKVIEAVAAVDSDKKDLVEEVKQAVQQACDAEKGARLAKAASQIALLCCT